MDTRRDRHLAGDPDDTLGEPLTPSEERVMRMTEEGMTREEVGHRLHRSHRTIAGHLRRAFAKLAPGRGRAGAFFEYGRRRRDR